jgi:hypothetical protein
VVVCVLGRASTRHPPAGAQGGPRPSGAAPRRRGGPSAHPPTPLPCAPQAPRHADRATSGTRCAEADPPRGGHTDPGRGQPGQPPAGGPHEAPQGHARPAGAGAAAPAGAPDAGRRAGVEASRSSPRHHKAGLREAGPLGPPRRAALQQLSEAVPQREPPPHRSSAADWTARIAERVAAAHGPGPSSSGSRSRSRASRPGPTP